MKRALILLAMVVVAAVAVDALGDLTQARPDNVPPGFRTEVVYDVEVNGYLQSVDDAARNLWGACAGTIAERLVVDEGVTQIAPGRYRLVLDPAIGEIGERKLRGCMEDATLERIKGDVVQVTRIPA